MVALCRIEHFGGLRIIQGESTISRFRTRKTAALLAFLAYHRDCPHPRETLTDMLWPWTDPAAGRRSLSMALSSLRHQLEPPGVPAGAVLVADRTNVQLNPEAATTDVSEFEAALTAAQGAPGRTAKETHLEEAIHLYRGELLPGLYESWIPAEQVRLSELYVGAVVEFAEVLAGRGETTEAVSHLRRAIEAEPLREEPYRRVIRLSAEHGEPGTALATYLELEHVLAEELGAKPSAETRRLIKELEELATRSPVPDLCPASLRTQHPTRRRRKAKLPTGIVTYLLVRADQDVVGKGPVDAHPLREEFRRHGGVEIGDGRAEHTLAFGRAGDAVSCAAQCQMRAKAQGPSPTPFAMAVHTGETAVGPDGSHPALHRAERLLAAAHPEQILCSEATAGLLRYDLDGGLSLRDLGVFRLRGASATEHVFQLHYPGCPDSAPLDAESGYTGHLPYQITRFFGRGQEIDQLEAVLTGDARLVTLIGPPGCGKTRLAIEIAAQLVEALKGKVWFVPLADLREGGDILDRALDPLSIRRSPQAAPLDQIAAALTEEPALIVFDNFEHLIESAGKLRTLLERLPDLRCLVTSRRRLGLAGEREYPVAPLPVPREASPAELLSNHSAQLFVDRAQAVKPDFQLTEGNAETVAELCRRLEGVPLAIELAAARSHTQGLRQVLDRLAKGEDLVTRSRDTDDRHRSLRAAVEWSYDLLAPELRRLLARLSVFRGGWTVEAAEAVCEEPLASDYLMQLVELSLVQLDQGARLEPRYSMLEIVRRYAAEQLERSGDEALVNDKHFRYFHGLVKQRSVDSTGPAGKELWLDTMEVEHDNLFSTLEWDRVAPARLEDTFRMVGTLTGFWESRGFWAVGGAVLNRLLSADQERRPTQARAWALASAGRLASAQGLAVDFIKSRYSEALAIARSVNAQDLEAYTLHGLGVVAGRQGDYAQARELFTEAVELYRTDGKELNAYAALQGLGTVAYDQGDYDSAWELFSKCLDFKRNAGHQAAVPGLLQCLGNVAMAKKDYSAASSLLEEALAIVGSSSKRVHLLLLCSLGGLASELGDTNSAMSRYSEALEKGRQLDDKEAVTVALANLGYVYQLTGDMERARIHLVELLRLSPGTGYQRHFAHALESTGRLALTQADQSQCSKENRRHAVRLWAAAQGIRQRIGTPSEDAWVQGFASILRDAVDAPTFEAAWEEGLAMTYDQAIASALDHLENGLARLCRQPMQPATIDQGGS